MNLIRNTSFTLVLLSFVVALNAAVQPPDSVGVKTISGKKYILHKVDPREGWLSISRRYQVDVNDLKQGNPEITDLKIGQIIMIPLGSPVPKKNEAILPSNTVQPANTGVRMDRHQGPVYHLVSKGETVFGIARKFQITPGELREWNTLADDNIKTGQKLIVGYAYLYKGNVKNDAAPGVVKQQEIVKHDPVIISEPVKKVEVAPLTSVQVKDTSSITLKDGKEDEKQKSRRELRKEKKEHEEREEKEKQTNTSVPVTQTIPPVQPKPVTPNHVAEPLKPTTLVKDTSKTVALNGKLNTPVMASASGKTKLVVETGIATWIDNTDINPNRYFALHRTAPIGTIIRVRNKMNSKYVFVKVVGVLPDTGDNANLIIKLSKAGAVKLDVIDARFQAELSFEVPE